MRPGAPRAVGGGRACGRGPAIAPRGRRPPFRSPGVRTSPGPPTGQGRGGIGLWDTEVELGLFRTMVMTRSVSCNGLADGSS